MSDSIKHECGIALIRLLKPLDYYLHKYNTPFYALHKMYLLMEKQHNRGQDGVGLANIKFDMPPGKRYISRVRSIAKQPIQDIFDNIFSRFKEIKTTNPELLRNTEWLKNNMPFTGELFLGHLRYGTYGRNSIESCHPFLRQNNWMTRNLVLAGNFNLTNVDELFNHLVEIGQHPKEKSDTVTVLEKIGHYLDKENDKLIEQYKKLGYNNREITQQIIQNLDLGEVLKNASKDWDGGYVMAGLIGHGDAFVFRDPNGIRPAYYYKDEEVVVVTSERPVIQTAFNVPIEKVCEIERGSALIIKKNGSVSQESIIPPKENKACSFERIYFSRGTDADIYKERKQLGRNVTPKILEAINYDLKNTVFSYIPNTAETSFYGMMKALDEYLNQVKKEKIFKYKDNLVDEKLLSLLAMSPRVEKIAVKDAKLRTFITQDNERNDLVAHVYDITYNTVRKGEDNLVVIDDSIVRGTTLRNSIIRILDRLNPKQIIIVSSAPQIRYPDCYGIDMAKLGEFVAFQAAVALLKENNKANVLDEVYRKCKEQENLPKEAVKNYVNKIYAPFTADQISEKISQLLTPPDVKAKVTVIYQTIEGLHNACPNHKGDWYFTGNYPTPGGNKVVNKAFINYMEGKNERAY
ncbi:MAG: amidophosphoribosyltransferase [Bacteroidetes bacterium]|nr:MAG: amidophosphoribosyltransferase [Bacteroidota bacterium]